MVCLPHHTSYPLNKAPFLPRTTPSTVRTASLPLPSLSPVSFTPAPPLAGCPGDTGHGDCRYAQDDLILLSYNVHGLNMHEKCTRLLRDLKRYNTSIAFLQETHFQEPTLKNRKHPLGYFSNNGVGILFSKLIPYTEHSTLRCEQGRYVFTKGTIQDQQYTFDNIYAPKSKQYQFLHSALNTLMRFAEGSLVLGGDLNLALHTNQDSCARPGASPDNRHAKTVYSITTN
ncbi:Hypothetical predicted protein [Pelobates cultripes]|uniref:Endonuclease/exonuclease/phosphatase domain-containing protein n=1 Tax=Pelobates cultripes TaxID=61616 RepID=A0AAD1SZW0_PELCU|nr:Hypothetical predicted protein [Pelobates cultripes]